MSFDTASDSLVILFTGEAGLSSLYTRYVEETHELSYEVLVVRCRLIEFITEIDSGGTKSERLGETRKFDLVYNSVNHTKVTRETRYSYSLMVGLAAILALSV